VLDYVDAPETIPLLRAADLRHHRYGDCRVCIARERLQGGFRGCIILDITERID
jgi:hypothetical protein